MMFNSYDIIYLMSNTFGTYTIFKFMAFFFDTDEANKRIEIISYIMYYLAIGTIYIMFNSPVFNLLSNLVLFFLLTLNYSSTLKSKLAATVYIYAILISVEALVVLGLKFLNLNRFTYSIDMELIIALISTKVISYIIMLALSNFKMIRNEINISFMHWIAIILIPLGTLASTFMMITIRTQYRLMLILISISILFIINVFIFYLYDALIKSYHGRIEKELLQQQNNAYIKQLEIINKSQESIKILRHDLRNHMTVLQTLIEKKDNLEALQYMQSILDFIKYGNEYVKSGNTEVDSVLNYKIYEAQKRNIKVDTKVNIPEKLYIEPFDFSVVLGNLLDNAIEAASKLEKERVVKVSINLDRNVLYINISNSFDGKLLYEDNKLKTTHKDKENHGLGLKSVKRVINKYNGTMNVSHLDEKFYVGVLIYNPVNNI